MSLLKEETIAKGNSERNNYVEYGFSQFPLTPPPPPPNTPISTQQVNSDIPQ